MDIYSGLNKPELNPSTVLPNGALKQAHDDRMDFKKDLVIKLWQSGKRDRREIAAACGLETKQVVGIVLAHRQAMGEIKRRGKSAKKRRWFKVPDELKAKVHEYRAKGYTHVRIARKTGVSAGSVGRILNEMPAKKAAIKSASATEKTNAMVGLGSRLLEDLKATCTSSIQGADSIAELSERLNSLINYIGGM